ncbi:MAG: TrmH family RNA methyltransferase [Acidimicrobiales bacterium]
MKALDGTGLKRLHREWRHRTDGRLGLILDNVQSPFNVGAIVRTAAAYRVEHAWLVGATPELDDAKVRKTALGCDRYLTWQRADTTADALAGARADGFSPIGLELADGASPLHELGFTGDVCLVIGHEDRGLGPATLDACDAVAYLPMLGKVGSLNVATATAIALYELRRQRW